MKPDDIKPGQWVAVVNEDDTGEDSMWIFGPRRRKTSVTGQPLKVLTVSLPFVVVTDGQDRFPIDVRSCTLSKVSRRYVNLLRRDECERTDLRRRKSSFGYDVINDENVRVRDSKKEKKAKDDGHPKCPMCKARLIARKRVNGPWLVACRECGFEGTAGTT